MQSFPGPEAPCTARRSVCGDIKYTWKRLNHLSFILSDSTVSVSNLSLRLDRLPCPSFFFFLFLSFLAAACFSNNAISVE